MNDNRHNGITDLSQTAVQIAREIDRLRDGAAAVFLQKANGHITQVEVVHQERLRLWVPETRVVIIDAE